MKKKIISLLLVFVLLFSVVAITACGKKEDGKDDDDDKKPSRPSGPNVDGSDDENKWWETITYPETQLRFKMTKCSNKEELPSGCERYLAGESSEAGEIDTLIYNRNEAAEANTKVTVLYDYYEDNASEYGWSKCIQIIATEVKTATATSPDMYCNFMTDILSASILQSFANLLSSERGEGSMKGENHIDRFADGYMGELMGSLTLSQNKMFVIASDYFIDLIRAFFIVPVNRYMYDGIASKVIEDLNGDGETNINDFFDEIRNNDWTYDRVAAYAKAVYLKQSNKPTQNLGDTIGFALSESSGLSAAGMVYTSSVTIIHKEWNDSRNDYDYYYPESGSELVALTTALSKLFNSEGVISVNDSVASDFNETTSLQAIRGQFSRDQVLFGGVILLGSLEYEEYQQMRGEGRGFGVAPAPLFRKQNDQGENEKYQTQIHVVGRAGAISYATQNFAQCTAFVQYQSTHSTTILDEYYNFNLTFDIAEGVDGTTEMLQYIRANVRTCFDKLYEDSIGFYFSDANNDALGKRWHSMISTASYKMDDMKGSYDSLRNQKQTYLEQLVDHYEKTLKTY